MGQGQTNVGSGGLSVWIMDPVVALFRAHLVIPASSDGSFPPAM